MMIPVFFLPTLPSSLSQMGFPRDDLASYLSGATPLVLDNFPELGFFRDIVYLFKVKPKPLHQIM